MIIRVQELLGRVKGFLREWEDGGAREAVAAARGCPCGCRFRHLHGGYVRFVVVVAREFRVTIPRLSCPACGRTASVLPWFLAPGSPYPWPLRQAAMVSFLGEKGGYRAALARFGLDWQLLWVWVEALAEKAKAMLAALLGIILRYPGLAEGGPLLPPAGELHALRARARSPSKRECLAAIGALLATGYRLWRAGFALGLGWGRPDPTQILGFLARLEPALA